MGKWDDTDDSVKVTAVLVTVLFWCLALYCFWWAWEYTTYASLVVSASKGYPEAAYWEARALIYLVIGIWCIK